MICENIARSRMRSRHSSGNSKDRSRPNTASGWRGPNTWREQVGDELLGVMREIKQLFDPKNLFNPGKIFSDGRFKIDNHLRVECGGARCELPFEPVLAFAFKDESFLGNLEQCNGCGGCRKDAPTMCPTFLATGEEYMSTRGRANAIRAALELRVRGRSAARARSWTRRLSNCLSCKACTVECPSNVNLALLKAELMHARHRAGWLAVARADA